MKNITSVSLIAIFTLTFIACGSKKEKTTTDQVTDLIEEIEKIPEAKTNAPKKIFNIESGYVKYKNKAAGQEMTREWWFDKFGERQYEENFMMIMDSKAGGMSLIADGIKYNWSYDSNEGTRVKYYSAPATDYEDISKEDIERYGIEKLGYEEIAGKRCLKVSTQEPMKATMWIWEGIPLKTVSSFGGNEVVMEAVEITTGNIGVVNFEVPESITFSDYQ